MLVGWPGPGVWNAAEDDEPDDEPDDDEDPGDDIDR